MTSVAEQYARALLQIKAPSPQSLWAMVVRRGHQRLLPQILREWEKLEHAKARTLAQGAITPEYLRRRALLELYQKLVTSR